MFLVINGNSCVWFAKITEALDYINEQAKPQNCILLQEIPVEIREEAITLERILAF